jgi:poly-gamma-glutamate synthesis protein (capsule biosynthesis protein)
VRSRLAVAAVTVLLALTACAGEAAPPAPTATPRPSPTVTATATPEFLEAAQVPPLTLAEVFPPRDLATLRLDPARLRTVIATGDVIPARGVDNAIRRRGDDFLFPVAATTQLTSNADLTVINLEAPLVSYCGPAPSGTFTFCGRPGFVQALQAAGVDVATLENNHIGNYGSEAIAETAGHLDSAGIAWADRDSPAVRDVRGLRFGFLAFNGVGERIDRQAMAAQIQALRPQVDVLMVAVHWGAEYVRVPQTAPGVADDDPIEIAHLAIDSGADVVIGNHPHWVQAVELYNGRFIAYAHGNFIFDQMWSYETRVGVVGRYTFYDKLLVGVEFVPVLSQDYAQPVTMQGAEAQAVLTAMQAASAELAAKLVP